MIDGEKVGVGVMKRQVKNEVSEETVHDWVTVAHKKATNSYATVT